MEAPVVLAVPADPAQRAAATVVTAQGAALVALPCRALPVMVGLVGSAVQAALASMGIWWPQTAETVATQVQVVQAESVAQRRLAERTALVVMVARVEFPVSVAMASAVVCSAVTVVLVVTEPLVVSAASLVLAVVLRAPQVHRVPTAMAAPGESVAMVPLSGLVHLRLAATEVPAVTAAVRAAVAASVVPVVLRRQPVPASRLPVVTAAMAESATPAALVGRVALPLRMVM